MFFSDGLHLNKWAVKITTDCTTFPPIGSEPTDGLRMGSLQKCK